MLPSTKSSKKTLENDSLSSWGHIVKVSKKHDCFGLGYHHTSYHLATRGGKKFNPVNFISEGCQLDSFVAVVDGVSSSQRTVSGIIRKCPSGFKLDNWTSIVVLMVFSEVM